MSFGPELATVAFALGAALSWGFGDFGGGLASRRAGAVGVVLVVDAAGALVIGSLAVAIGGPVPTASTLALAGATGVVGAAAILALYQALAIGRMGIVAPVAGVLGASMPVVVGFALQGPPSPTVAAGIGLGIVAVVLVSRVPLPPGGRSGLGWAVAAGILIGLFNVLVSRFPANEVLWPLGVLRLTATLAVALFAALGRRPWRVPRATLPLAVGVGVADAAGNAFYIAATHAGRLDVAAVVSSLFPVITVILAIALLHERLTASHAAGIVAAAGAIALIAAG